MKGIWIGVIVGVSLAVVIIVVGVALGLTLGKKDFKSTFMENCEKHNGANCQEIWKAFYEAYVGKNFCEVPMEAYDDLIKKAPIKPMYSTALLWSKTKDFARSIADKTDNVTLKDTLLGSLVGDKSWCGIKGSNETKTDDDCPRWDSCENNPISSFWKRASTAFADAAHDDVTALLNGDIDDAFSPTSTFRSIELKRLKYPQVKNMNVVLVTKNYPGKSCSKPFLEDLRRELGETVTYCLHHIKL